MAAPHVGPVQWNRARLWSELLWLLRVCSCSAVDVNFRGDRGRGSRKPEDYVMCLSSKDFSFLLVLFHGPVGDTGRM